MPANVTPEYKKAEAEFRRARGPRERLQCLREMLRTIPKHKGTEHLQADIKTRIKQLTEELAAPRKGGTRTGPPQALRPEGAAQVSLIGPANAGKSSLLARLTGASTEIGPYPYTTKIPIPGMLPYKDIHFQLVDLPPVSREFMEGWFINALQPADAALLVVDVSDPECVDHVQATLEQLEARRVSLEEHWPHALEKGWGEGAAPDPSRADPGEEVPDPFRIRLPTLLLANKSDLDPDPQEVEVLEELVGVRFPAMAVSARTGEGLDRLGPFLFHGLGIVRVYTKVPGHPPDMGRPYAVRRGATMLDVARLVHRDIARSLRFARVWGSGQFDGQQVGPDHVVADGDVVELHA